ncbi:MAG: Crp/Fnr family transcriptional regulator [Deltaproteobacteria bacterium]|jgi:CRP/FNR family transcriptional regulator|nr:Crp/Fnr family transcriptional regulator [Deltaproteobacteria bacterium]
MTQSLNQNFILSAASPQTVKAWVSQVLGQSMFFEGLSDNLLAKLADIGVSKSYSTGQILFHCGDSVAGFHLVASGLVKIFLLRPDGRERILNLCQPGTVFGEAAVFRLGGYPASALALEETTTILLPTAAFRLLLSKNPDLAMAIIGVLAQRLNHFRQLIESGGIKLLTRLASFILDLAKASSQVTLPTTKAQLALRLGTTPESLSRALTKLKRASLITETKSFLTITNRKLLEAVANEELEL